MSTWNIYRCDECKCEVRHAHLPMRWIHIDGAGFTASKPFGGDFCSLDCAMKHLTTVKKQERPAPRDH